MSQKLSVGVIVFLSLVLVWTFLYKTHQVAIERGDYLLATPESPYYQDISECPPEYRTQPQYFFLTPPPRPFFVPGVTLSVGPGWYFTPGFGLINVGYYNAYRPMPHSASEHHEMHHLNHETHQGHINPGVEHHAPGLNHHSPEHKPMEHSPEHKPGNIEHQLKPRENPIPHAPQGINHDVHPHHPAPSAPHIDHPAPSAPAPHIENHPAPAAPPPIPPPAPHISAPSLPPAHHR